MNRKMKRLLSLAVVLFMLMAQLGANIVNISAVRAETLDETAVSEGLTEGSSTAGSAGDGEAAPPAEAPDEDAAATGDSAVSGEVSSAPELPDEATAATDDSEAAETLPADVPDEEADASQEAADETDSTSASEEASDAGDAGEAAAGTEGETSAPPAPDNETDAAEDAETEAEASQNPGAPAPFSDFGIRGFGISPQKLNPGETIKEIQAPVPNTFKVMVGTALSAIGLPATIKVVYNKTDGTEEARDEDVTWAAADPAAPYDPEKDGDYTLKATFTDDSLKDQVGPNVTVTVQGQAVADEIEALPSVADAANLQMAEKDTLRSQLIAISNALSDFGPDEMTALEAYLGAPEMDKYQELYGTYVSGGDYSIADFLDGDWAYLRHFELDGIQDGTGPFDTSNDPDDPSYCNRPGNDDGPNNGKVRTFDTVSYDLSYQTDVSGEYLGITNGYLYYEFILPYPTDQAEWEFTGMAWIGRKLANKADLATKKDGEGYYHYEVREVDGVMSQVITGKRFLAPVAPNPAAIPGAGTLNAVMRVLNADNNAQLKPVFRAWLDHNHTDGECPVHSREEVKSFVADPVTVTSELRMNVQLKSVPLGYANGLDTFNFTTGNELALNRDKGNVYGRLTAFGVTLQVYNPDPNDGLKGVAFPKGEITFDIDFAVKYQRDDGTTIDNLPPEYTPLVWSYERNKSGSGQSDGRSIATYAPLQYAVGGAPYSPNTNGPSTAYSPLTGSGSVWNGGNWTATQITDSKVSFKVDNYVVNPNYFPNTDAGNTTSAATYFDPANGVRSTNIGAISGGEIFVITPFGEGANYLPVRYAGNGTIQMDIVDSNLRANSNAGSLDIVTDNSNQTKPTRVPLKDDRLSNTVYLSMPGTWTNMIRYIKSVSHNYNTELTLKQHLRISIMAKTRLRGARNSPFFGEGFMTLKEPRPTQSMA
ncbi:MAG: hypothetical protein QM296_13720 [Bacillota bacterium]|nr:hypothetical protein [Bacillota bacterium]